MNELQKSEQIMANKDSGNLPSEGPAKLDKHSVNIPGDGSCLFWSVALAYLTPVKNKPDSFKKRYEKLSSPEILVCGMHKLLL